MSFSPPAADRRNCLLLEPNQELDLTPFVSLQAAIKNAIQVSYQLEDNELATEILPNSDSPRMLLLYESAEGGAGVLPRLLDDPNAFAQMAARALELCHFDPSTGDDRRRAVRATEDCEAACYDCLMHYGNQPVHRDLDRRSIRDLLLEFSQAATLAAPSGQTRPDHLSQLKRLAGSNLERDWLDFLDGHHLRLPSHAQHLIESCQTRPDFFYTDYQAAIYVDGPHHDLPERTARDSTLIEAMEDQGFTVIRFHHRDNWSETVARFRHVFGRSS